MHEELHYNMLEVLATFWVSFKHYEAKENDTTNPWVRACDGLLDPDVSIFKGYAPVTGAKLVHYNKIKIIDQILLALNAECARHMESRIKPLLSFIMANDILQECNKMKRERKN